MEAQALQTCQLIYMCVMFRVSGVVAIVSAVTREARDLREAGLRLVLCVDLRLSSPRVGKQYYRDVYLFRIVICDDYE